MTSDELLVVINVILEGKDSPAITALNESASLRDDVGLDSFDLAELTARVEQKCGVDIFADGVVESVGEVLSRLR